jgi:hypothetical protein
VLTTTLTAALLVGAPAAAASRSPEARPQQAQPRAQVAVFLDCQTNCFQDFLRSEITFVDYVRDRNEADVHALVTSIETGSGGREYTIALTGLRTFQGVTHALKTVTTPSDPPDVIRRQLATTLRIGLLNYVARDGVPQGLEVDVALGTEQRRPAVAGDRWNNWVFSLRGSASVEGEESNRELQFGGSIGADRITPDWKITLAGELDHRREEFDLDEDAPVSVERREREFRGLVVKALGEHWSAGAGGEIRSSTFSNTAFVAGIAAAVEFNVFPYATYAHRQLRVNYLIGVDRARYNEETLFGKTEETLPNHEIAMVFDQNERWGSLEASVEWSQYLHDRGKYRIETDGEVSWRVARGLSISAEGRASLIRDQLSLPRRGATPEEILLRLRQLRSGYDYDFRFSLTYTFGSIFSAVVNPRFGR